MQCAVTGLIIKHYKIRDYTGYKAAILKVTITEMLLHNIGENSI